MSFLARYPIRTSEMKRHAKVQRYFSRKHELGGRRRDERPHEWQAGDIRQSMVQVRGVE